MNHFCTTLGRKVGASLAILLFVVAGSTAAPSRAHAVWGVADIVFDPGSLAQMIVDWGIQLEELLLNNSDILKEYVYDGIVRYAASAALEALTQSIANWAANGFEGSPSFETNLQNSFLRIGDTVARNFGVQLTNGTSIQSPFTVRIGSAIVDTYFNTTGDGAFIRSARFTLSDHCENYEAFMAGDFSACGTSGWINMWTNPANNPLGFGTLAQNELNRRVGTEQSTYAQQIDWGSGFRSLTNCGTEGAPAEGETASGTEAVSLTEGQQTEGCTTDTPGALIAHSVNSALVDAGIDLQVSADEISELIGLFFSSLLQDQILGGSGLAGATNYQRPEGGTVGGQTLNTLRVSLSNEKPRVEQFKTDWTTILEVAQRARARLTSCSSEKATQLLEERVTPVIEQAEGALERADQTLEKYAEFETRLATEMTREEFDAFLQEYNAFTNESGIPPSIQEYLYATKQAVDVPPPAPATLYRQMKELADSSCIQIALMPTS